MPDEASPTPASGPALDDIERRLAAFESATKRLSRTVADTDASSAAAATRQPSSSQRPAVTPFGSDEPSGLRPAVVAPAPVTGALTARRRSESGTTPAQPGFTSAYGKPPIPAAAPAPMAAAAPSAPASTSRHRPRIVWWRDRRVFAACAVLGVVLFLLAVPRLFRELPDAMVWAESERCVTPVAGQVSALSAQVGDTVASGTALARVGDSVITAPYDGVVTRLLVSPGGRVAAGEPIAELAQPQTLRVVVAVPPSSSAAVGDRVSARLLGEERISGGMIERILSPGEPGAWSGGAAPRRAVIVLDPAPTAPRLGQGARVTVLGRDPGALRLALFALRRMLPW